MKHFLRLCALLTGLAGFVFSAFAQAPTGDISGTVYDESGAVVPNATVVISHVNIERVNQFAIGFIALGSGDVIATIRDSVLSGPGFHGFSAVASVSATNQIPVMIDRTAIQFTETGVDASRNGALVRIGRSTITGNTTGLESAFGGTLVEYTNNMIEGNGDDAVTPLSRRR